MDNIESSRLFISTAPSHFFLPACSLHLTMTSSSTTSSSPIIAPQLVLTERMPLDNNNNDNDSDEESTISEALLITLNRPTKKNCFNAQLCRELATIFYNVANEIEGFDDHITTDAGGGGRRRRRRRLAAVLFTGAGQSFCAGADLTDPPNPIHHSSDLSHYLRFNPVYQMSRLGVPIIGVLRGHVSYTYL